MNIHNISPSPSISILLASSAMEDAHTCLLNIVSSDSKLRGQKVSFFAVFDGHGGHTIAQYAGASLHKRLTNDPAFEEADWKKALKSSFLGIDVDLRQGETDKGRRGEGGKQTLTSKIPPFARPKLQ